MKEVAKKLSMKKTFFVTQLESFFNTITQEYQEKFNSLEVENRLLIQKTQTQQKDIDSLIEIRNNLSIELEATQVSIKKLEDELKYTKSITVDEHNLELIRENNLLKSKLEISDNQNSDDEVELLKQKIINLQSFIQKGAGAYNQSIMNRKNEEIVKEISDSLKK